MDLDDDEVSTYILGVCESDREQSFNLLGDHFDGIKDGTFF